MANTHKPRLLFETGLPVRTYIPPTDCKLELLVPSNLHTSCPYKVENSLLLPRCHSTNNPVLRVLQTIITFRQLQIRQQRTLFGGTKIQIWNVQLSMDFWPFTMSV